jgi:hypothetical protein
MENKMGGISSLDCVRREIHVQYQLNDQKKMGHFGNPGINHHMLIKQILKKHVVKM